MESFKGILKKRLALMSLCNILAFAFIVLTGIYGNMTVGGSENIAEMIRGFQVGVFSSLQLMIGIYIIKYIKALRIGDELNKLYIEEKDERTKFIKDKIGGVGFNFCLGVIATATVISGFFHQIVFATLLGVLIFIVLVKAFLKIYYKFNV